MRLIHIPVSFILIALLAACGCGDPISGEEFAELVEEAEKCQEGDRCVVAATGPSCLCGVLVREEKAQQINEAALELECGSDQVRCSSVANLRCEEGACDWDMCETGPIAHSVTVYDECPQEAGF